MFCKGCNYELLELGTWRCPECGRSFDPKDPSSYSEVQRYSREQPVNYWLGWLVVAMGCGTMLAQGYGLFALLVARLVLGRWPHRSGMDDPKQIEHVDVIGAGAISILGASLYLPLGMVVLAVIVGIEVGAWRAVRCWLLGMLIWAAGIALFVWDPLDIWLWLFD